MWSSHVYHIINLPPHHLSPSFVVNELELATGAIYSGWPTMNNVGGDGYRSHTKSKWTGVINSNWLFYDAIHGWPPVTTAAMIVWTNGFSESHLLDQLLKYNKFYILVYPRNCSWVYRSCIQKMVGLPWILWEEIPNTQIHTHTDTHTDRKAYPPNYRLPAGQGPTLCNAYAYKSHVTCSMTF